MLWIQRVLSKGACDGIMRYGLLLGYI